MKYSRDTFEVIFYARGGQGAKTASELVAHAAVAEGKYVKAFPFYGPERSGAPTRMFLRVSDNPIRTQEPIDDPDVVVVMDDTLVGVIDVTKNLDEHELLIVNTKRSPESLRAAIPDYKGKIYAVDATKIALEKTGNPNPNTVLVGQLIKVSEIISLDSAAEIFRGVFTEKIGKELTEKNIRAMEVGYDSL